MAHQTFYDWIRVFSETGKAFPIEETLLLEFFVSHGANSQISQTAREALSKYPNAGKAPAMREIWGDRYDRFKEWSESYVKAYETANGLLPALEKSGSKTSGMVQFLGELTAYAYGALNYDDFRIYLEARILNGRLWKEGKKDERVKIKVPTDEEPIRPSSIPPEFPLAFLAHIDSWRV